VGRLVVVEGATVIFIRGEVVIDGVVGVVVVVVVVDVVVVFVVFPAAAAAAGGVVVVVVGVVGVSAAGREARSGVIRTAAREAVISEDMEEDDDI